MREIDSGEPASFLSKSQRPPLPKLRGCGTVRLLIIKPVQLLWSTLVSNFRYGSYSISPRSIVRMLFLVDHHSGPGARKAGLVVGDFRLGCHTLRILPLLAFSDITLDHVCIYFIYQPRLHLVPAECLPSRRIIYDPARIFRLDSTLYFSNYAWSYTPRLFQC